MKKKNKIDQIKGHTKVIANLIVGCGVCQIMANVMKEYKPDAKGVQKLVIKLGAAAMTGAIIKMVSDYVEGSIDEVFDTAEEVVKKAATKGKEENENVDAV